MEAAQQLMSELCLVRPVFDQSLPFERIVARQPNPNRLRHTVRAQCGGQLCHAHRMKAVDVAEVLLARPEHFHRLAGQGFGNADGLQHFAVHSAHTKAAAFETIVHEHIVGREPGEFRRGERGGVRALRAEPDLRFVGAHLRRAIGRLHLRVGLVIELIFGFDDFGRAAEC